MKYLELIKHHGSTVTKLISNNSPAIMSGMAVTGVLGCIFLTARATPLAIDLVNEERERLYQEETGNDWPVPTGFKLTWQETIKVAWKPYLPTAVCALFTIGCVIGSNVVSQRRNAALVSLLSVADTTLKEYQNVISKEFGDDKRKEIAEKVKDNTFTQKVEGNTPLSIRDGQQYCFDMYSGREFISDYNSICRAENEINRQILRDDTASVNELYYLLGLDDIGVGNESGWTVEKCPLEIKFSTYLNKDKKACLCIAYETVLI